MADSTAQKRKGKPQKPGKPYPTFPLFPHATGRWAKKIRGKFVYFGPWADPDAALEKYLADKEYLEAGRVPPVNRDGLQMRDLCNRFLTSKRNLVQSDELAERSFKTYFSACERVCEAFGKDRPVDDLSTEDFEKLRSTLSKGRNPVSLGNEIRLVRMIFKYGYDSHLIENPIRFGQSFKMPSRKTLRKSRLNKDPRMFEAEQLRAIIESASQPLKAMILLGVNCGFGQTDVANLPEKDIDFGTGFIDFPRPKTAIERRCPMWPETDEALSEALTIARKPKLPEDAELAFITKYGHQWVRTGPGGSQVDGVAQEFSKLLKELKLKKPGLNFYALRHTFQTIGEESRDMPAVKSIMGHVDESMSGAYRERISDERLKNVTNTVRDWLFAE